MRSRKCARAPFGKGEWGRNAPVTTSEFNFAASGGVAAGTGRFGQRRLKRVLECSIEGGRSTCWTYDISVRHKCVLLVSSLLPLTTSQVRRRCKTAANQSLLASQLNTGVARCWWGYHPNGVPGIDDPRPGSRGALLWVKYYENTDSFLTKRSPMEEESFQLALGVKR